MDKALALLDAFGEEHTTGVGVSELARRTNLSKSTAFGVLAILERNGAVERAGIQYRLGPFVQRLSAPKATSEDTLVRETLTPFLVNLYERTRHTVHLAVLERTDVIYLNNCTACTRFRRPRASEAGSPPTAPPLERPCWLIIPTRWRRFWAGNCTSGPRTP